MSARVSSCQLVSARAWFRWILRIPGTLLLLAAALKTQGLALEPVGRVGLFTLPEVELAVIGFEAFLGFWLWSGKNPAGAWIISVLTFSAFAGVSFYLGWVGQSSCGCFGALAMSPWYAFALDLLILVMLAVGFPDLRPLWASPTRSLVNAMRPVAWGVVGIAINLGLLLILAHTIFGSVPSALAYLRGERISVHPRMVEIEEGVPGETRKVKVEVANWTDEPIRLIGGTTDCACTVLGDLPVTIPARETRTVTVDIFLSARPGIYTRKATFLVDDHGFRHISFSMTGRILEVKEISAVSGKEP